MNARQPAPAPQPLRGSWEDLFAQGQQKAANFNDEAIPLLRKVFDGLRRLPESKRKSGDGRLQDLLIRSALALHGYLNLRDRYDESLEVLAQAQESVDPDDRDEWETQIADVLIQAGRTDEGIARLHALAQQPESEVGDWGRLVMALVRAGKPQAALPYLDEAEARLTAASAQAEAGAEGTAEDDADYEGEASYLQGLRAVVAIESQDWERGVAAFKEVLDGRGAYAQHPHLVYGRLINAGRHEDALLFLNRDQGHPVRSGFWRGLSFFKQGQAGEAKRTWQRVTSIKPDQGDQGSLVEYTLSHFYLGDETGSALAGVLGVIREQQQRVPWSLFLLAGIGWAVRHDLDAARSNLQIAVAQRKSAAEGRLLPHQYWFMVEGALDDEAKAALREYFEAEPNAAGGEA